MDVASVMAGKDNPGWVNDQWKFWRGEISAGAGPAAVANPLGATGDTSDTSLGGAPDNYGLSVDSQTYPFQLQGGNNPVKIVARQPVRTFLSIQNTGMATIYVYIGTLSQNVAINALALTIVAGDKWEPKAGGTPVDDIYAWTTGVNATGVVITGS